MLKRIDFRLAFFLVLISIIFFAYYFAMRSHTINSIIGLDNIENKSHKIIEQCGENYWFTWIAVGGKNYIFKDVIGCNRYSANQSCVFSVKEKKLNSYYDRKDLTVDQKSYDLLDRLNTGDIGYIDNIENYKEYAAVYEALTQANLKIKEAHYTIKKNIFMDIIYLFLISNTGSEKCSKQDLSRYLIELVGENK